MKPGWIAPTDTGRSGEGGRKNAETTGRVFCGQEQRYSLEAGIGVKN